MNTDKAVPPPPDSIPSWIDTDKAKQEEKNWDKEGFLRGQEEKNHLLWLKAYGVVVFLFFVFFSLLFLSALSAWAVHYLAPRSWYWLEESQLSKIQSVIFSGSLGSIITFIAQKQFSK